MTISLMILAFIIGIFAGMIWLLIYLSSITIDTDFEDGDELPEDVISSKEYLSSAADKIQNKYNFDD